MVGDFSRYGRAMSVGPVLAQLRRATGDVHRGLDEGLRAVERLASPFERGAMVRGYAHFYAAADAAIAPWLKDVAGLDYAARRRTPLLIAGAKPQGPPFPALRSRAQSLGALYVVEGSTLGGRMILRDVAASGADISDLRFLDAYGALTGERWRDFLAVLEAQADDHEAVVAGALATFAFAEACLCAEEVAA